MRARRGKEKEEDSREGKEKVREGRSKRVGKIRERTREREKRSKPFFLMFLQYAGKNFCNYMSERYTVFKCSCSKLSWTFAQSTFELIERPSRQIHLNVYIEFDPLVWWGRVL